MKKLSLKNILLCVPPSVLIGFLYASFAFGKNNFFSQSGLANVNPFILIPVYLSAFAIVTLTGKYMADKKLPVRETAVICFALVSSAILARYKMDNSLFTILACSTVIYACLVLKRDSVLTDINLSDKKARNLLICFFIIYTLYSGGITILKHLCWLTEAFDSGIFTQIFYSINKNFTPVSTLENPYASSHFGIHVSPFLYVIAPGFLLFPSTIYLITLQVLFQGSSVFPLFKIAKLRRMTNFQALLMVLILLLNPIMINTLLYSFHVYEMSIPLILWLLYFMEKRKLKYAFMAALLVMLVREDMGIICFCIGLYGWLALKEKRYILMSVFAVIWFYIAVKIIIPAGDGQMFFDRYKTLMIDGTGMLEVIKTSLRNPLYVLQVMFNKQKLFFIIQMLIPFLFIPLLRLRGLILLLPAVVMHLLSSHIPQHTLYHQYPAVTLVLCAYLATANSAFIRRKKLLTQALVIGALLTLMLRASYTRNHLHYVQMYTKNRQRIEILNAVKTKVPEQSGVSASWYLASHYAARNNLRVFPDSTDCDFIVLDLRYPKTPNFPPSAFIRALITKAKEGYKVVLYRRGCCLVLKKGYGDPVSRQLIQDIMNCWKLPVRNPGRSAEK